MGLTQLLSPNIIQTFCVRGKYVTVISQLIKKVFIVTIPLSVLPIFAMYCRPTPDVKLPLFQCPELSKIKLNPFLNLV